MPCRDQRQCNHARHGGAALANAVETTSQEQRSTAVGEEQQHGEREGIGSKRQRRQGCQRAGGDPCGKLAHRHQGIARASDIDGTLLLAAAVEAGRCCRRGAHLVDRGRGNGLDVGRGICEVTEAVEGEERNEGLRIAGRGTALGAAAGGGRQIEHASQHLDEQSRHRKVRPVGIRRDVEQHDQPLAFLLGGHQRRAVGKARPDLSGQVGIGLGQHLARHLHRRVGREAGKRALVGEGLHGLRRLPAERAAERAVAGAQRHRHEAVLGAGETGPCEAHQHAAIVHPARDHLLLLARQHADVGQHQHGKALVELGLECRGIIGLAHLGIGVESTLHIVERCKQGLGHFERGARHHRHGLAPPAIVHQEHGSGVALVLDGDAAHLITQLGGKLDDAVGRGGARVEGDGNVAEAAPVAGRGSNRHRLCRPAGRAQHADLDLAAVEARRHQGQWQLCG